MRTLSVFSFMFGIELWCPWFKFESWQLGTEYLKSTREHLFWVGPLHFGFSPA